MTLLIVYLVSMLLYVLHTYGVSTTFSYYSVNAIPLGSLKSVNTGSLLDTLLQDYFHE